VLINPARNPSIFRRRFPIRLWYPSQHLLRQNPLPKSPFGSPRRFAKAAAVRLACHGLTVLSGPANSTPDLGQAVWEPRLVVRKKPPPARGGEHHDDGDQAPLLNALVTPACRGCTASLVTFFASAVRCWACLPKVSSCLRACVADNSRNSDGDFTATS
jgi:hypothetical protein